LVVTLTRSRHRLPRIELVSVVLVAISFVTGVLVGFLASPVEGIVIGLLSEVFLETLHNSYRERDYQLRLSALRPVPRGPDFVSKLADVGAVIDESDRSDLLRDELQVRMAEFEAHVDHLIRGRIVRDGGDVTDMLVHTNECEREIRATTTLIAATVEDPASWWQARGGREYWEANTAALTRGVQITRVFVIDQLTDAVSRLMEVQRAAGVSVYYVEQDLVPTNLRTNVVIWDGEVAWRAQMSTTGHVSENRFYTRKEDVRQLETVFRASRIRATEFVPPAAVTVPAAPLQSVQPVVDVASSAES
jgi:hypothetical protein